MKLPFKTKTDNFLLALSVLMVLSMGYAGIREHYKYKDSKEYNKKINKLHNLLYIKGTLV